MSISGAVLEAADEFVAQLRRRQIEGSLPCAKRTAEILRLLVTKSRHPTAEALLEDVRVLGIRLQAAKPLGACHGRKQSTRKQSRMMAPERLHMWF